MTEKKNDWMNDIQKCYLTERLTDWPIPTVRLNPDTLMTVVQSIVQATRKATLEEVGERLQEALDALGMMYSQYCSENGHFFMSAGETASGVLARYGMLNDDGAGRGEVRDIAVLQFLSKLKEKE